MDDTDSTVLGDLGRQARALTFDQRWAILKSQREVVLHQHLKSLFEAMEPTYAIEVTHGKDELGKDLVLVRQDNITTDVIGVVVKRGDISGKTSGDVDELKAFAVRALSGEGERRAREVESQIQQAREHEAELSSNFAKLSVNKVIVIIAGRLSGNARTRLQRELRGAGEVHDARWLVEQFTLYYPQVFFDGEAIDFIQGKIEELETRNWLVASDKNLSEWFVEPLVSSMELPSTLGDSMAMLVDRRRTPLSTLSVAAAGTKRVVLCGDMGSGKSAALTKLALDALKEAHRKTCGSGQHCSLLPVPIAVSAKQLLTIDSVGDLLEWFCPAESVRERLTLTALLVDALDEVPRAVRADAIARASAFADAAGCHLVIASRKIDAVKSAPPGFQKFELMPFELGQAFRFLEKVLAGNSQLLSELREGLTRVEFQIPFIPLSLVLLVELVQEHKEVPASATELYDRFTELALGREDKRKGIEVLFEYLAKKRFLAALAYHEFLQKDRLEVPLPDYERFCEEYASEYGWSQADVESFPHELERGGLLDVKDVVRFAHRSFLDYFVAWYLSHRRDEHEGLTKRVVDLYFDDLWTDVAFFFVGMKREISRAMLDAIIDHPDQSIYAQFTRFMLGRLLQAGWHSPASIKEYGVRRGLESAAEVREGFLRATEQHRDRVPRIYADFILLSMSDISYRSTFLQQQLGIAYNEAATTNPRLALVVLWALKPFLSREELLAKVAALVRSLTSAAAEDEAAVLALLRALDTNDKEIEKTIGKRLRRLDKQFPGLLRSILPPPRLPAR